MPSSLGVIGVPGVTGDFGVIGVIGVMGVRGVIQPPPSSVIGIINSRGDLRIGSRAPDGFRKESCRLLVGFIVLNIDNFVKFNFKNQILS